MVSWKDFIGPLRLMGHVGVIRYRLYGVVLLDEVSMALSPNNYGTVNS